MEHKQTANAEPQGEGMLITRNISLHQLEVNTIALVECQCCHTELQIPMIGFDPEFVQEELNAKGWQHVTLTQHLLTQCCPACITQFKEDHHV